MNSEDFPRRSPPSGTTIVRCASALAVLAIGATGPAGRLDSASAAEPPAVEQKINWEGLDGLLVAGDYEKAVAAAAAIAERVRPQRRAADFVPRSAWLIRALTRRGVAEARLGRLDAAKRTVDEACRTLTDKDFQRLYPLFIRQLPAKEATLPIQLELEWIDLLDLRAAVIIEQMRAASRARSDGDGSSAATDDAGARRVEDWLAELKAIEKTATEAREAIAGRFDKAGPAVLASPYSRALVGSFRPEMTAGMKAVEEARLLPRQAAVPALGKETTANAPARDRPQLLAAARRHLEKAAEALDDAITAAKPSATATLRPEQRIEAALMQAEWLIARGAVGMEAGEPAQAQADFTKALDLQREVAVLRKRSEPTRHPDRFLPLLLAAESALEQSRRLLADGDSDGGQAAAKQAAGLLAEAAGLPVAADQPLRRHLAALEARLVRQKDSLGALIPRADAANAAARRQRRAIDATAASGSVW